jgi:hypothetical protein
MPRGAAPQWRRSTMTRSREASRVDLLRPWPPLPRCEGSEGPRRRGPRASQAGGSDLPGRGGASESWASGGSRPPTSPWSRC